MTGRAGRILLTLVVALVSLAMAGPLLWMLLSSLRTDSELLSTPFALPARPHWEQWSRAWTEGKLGPYGWNSLRITGTTVLVTVLLGAMAGYGLARGGVGGARGLAWYLPGLVVPAQAAAVPTFLLLRALRLLDTEWALILPYVGWNLPLSVYVFYGFFRSQSVEPEEAARLDGCGPAVVFWRVALPLARPAAGVVAIITALSAWNEFLFALLFIHGEAARVLPLALLAFSTAHTTDYGLTFAALSLMSLPMLVAYAFVQRTLIEGTSGAVGW